jgi:hypothetical protein
MYMVLLGVLGNRAIDSFAIVGHFAILDCCDISLSLSFEHFMPVYPPPLSDL